MKDNRNNAFRLMLQSEGGFVNYPSDPGGMTNLGVTKATWESWVGREVDESEMRGLTPEKVKPLYMERYWDAVRGDELPMGLDYLMFDFAVNAGAGRAIKTLQTAVGVPADGGFGPITMGAVQTTDPVELIEWFSQSKEDFYRSLTTFSTFGTGWLNRVATAKQHATSMVT